MPGPHSTPKPRFPTSSKVIRRIRDTSYDVATQTWKVQLDCFHKLTLGLSDHNMSVVARWCPSCFYALRGTVTV